MKPGQRIELILSVANALNGRDWREIDLVLSQFGFPTEEQYNGQADNYCIDMVERGEDSKLIDLYQYLIPNTPLSQLSKREENGHWEEDTFRVFMSHSSKNKAQVSQVKQELVRRGVECFVAHDDITPTKEWLEEIEKALRTCHTIVAFLNDDFKSSDFCDQEVGYGLQRGILIVPVRMGKDPYGFMSRYQGVNAANKDPLTIANDIYKILATNPLSKELVHRASLPAIEQVVNSFLDSGSFATASSNLTEVEQLDVIPPQLLMKIEKEWENNSQITHSFGVPDRVKSLIAAQKKLNSF